MSDVIAEPGTEGNQTQVTEDDLRRMLDEVRKEKDDLTRERDTERSTRYQTQQELEQERAARFVTEQERDGHAARVVNEAEHRYNAQKEAVKNGIEAQKERATTAEEAYARHAETGEWKLAAAAQKQMAEATARLTNLEAQHEYLETHKDTLVPPVTRQETRQVQQRPPAFGNDRISQIVGGDLVSGERAWLEKRPKFIDDVSYQRQVFGASQLAAGKGYSRGSEPYFKEMERILGEGETESRQTESRQTEPRQERAPSADIAPQRRASPGQDVRGSREIRLTADQAEVADGLYGNPNGSDYISDPAERYKKYYDNLERRRAAGRM